MTSKFFGLGAKMALCLVAVLGTLTSCYEKEDIKTVIDTTPKTVTYTLSGVVYNYANLDNIKNAEFNLLKDGQKVDVTINPSGENGGYVVRLEKLVEKDRGTYTLTVTANGYKNRTVNFDIYFEKADNQTIVNQMDIALKSNDKQGEPIEVVAGNEEKVMEITGADENGNQVTDVITLPAGLLGDGVAQTISIQREGKEAELQSNALRVYEGQPSGLKFEKPIEFTFKAQPGQSLNVYYEEGGIWKIADTEEHSDAAAVVDNGDGTYTAKIYHFSRFKFAAYDYQISWESSVCDTVPSKLLDSVTEEYVAYTEADEAQIAWKKEVAVGYRFKDGKSLEEIFDGCVVKDRAIAEVVSFLNANDTKNIAEGKDFNMDKVEGLVVTVPAYFNVKALTVDYACETITLPLITIDGKSYQVVLEHVKGQTLSYVGEGYTHDHGHGHGDNLNAGGGIIDFE